MPTLRQKLALKNLPKYNYNIAESMRKAGYTNMSAYAGSNRKFIRENTKEYFNEESVRRDIKKVKKLVLKEKDYTNFLRATELQSKILGMQLDRSEINNNNPDKVILINTSDEKKIENKKDNIVSDDKK